MATKQRKFGFNAPATLAALATEACNLNPRWFEVIYTDDRLEFSLRYATKTWNVSPTGNACSIVVSYPRPNGKVRMYDIDSGEFFWVSLKTLTQKRVSGRNVENHYHYNALLLDKCFPETDDIVNNVDWHSLDRWNEGRGRRTMPPLFSLSEEKLIALPRRFRSVNRNDW